MCFVVGQRQLFDLNEVCVVQSLVNVGNKNWICMIFRFKMGKTGNRTYSLLQVEFGDEAFSWSTVF